MNRIGIASLVALSVLLLCLRAGAVEIWTSDDGERFINLTTALKATTVDPEGGGSTNLWRFRLDADAKLSEQLKLELAYEHRARSVPSDGGQGLVVLPPDADAPFRLSQGDAVISEEDDFLYRHELDRALAALHFDGLEVTVGRQAVGWGRGVVFSAVDVFSPFSPLEVDRDWRKGVDAVRIEMRLADTYSFEVVGAFGEHWDESALLGRLRGYSGAVDGELIFGKRAEDDMYAGTISASVGDAEVHGELAFFDTPEEFDDGGLFGDDDLVAKAVLGASYTFDIGSGLTLWAEYHYSGFGTDEMDEVALRFLDEDYLERFLRGDMQMIGKRAVAFQSAYELDDSWSASLLWLFNPDDESGVVSPGLSCSVSDETSILISAHFPYGREADRLGIPRTEYGDGPASVFLQVSVSF